MLKIKKIRGKLKGFFFLWKMHKIVPADLFEFLSYLTRLSGWINKYAANRL